MTHPYGRGGPRGLCNARAGTECKQLPQSQLEQTVVARRTEAGVHNLRKTFGPFAHPTQPESLSSPSLEKGSYWMSFQCSGTILVVLLLRRMNILLFDVHSP